MNFSEILNSAISGLFCTTITGLTIYLYKLVKKSHSKNKKLFWNNVLFYRYFTNDYYNSN